MMSKVFVVTSRSNEPIASGSFFGMQSQRIRLLRFVGQRDREILIDAPDSKQKRGWRIRLKGGLERGFDDLFLEG